MLFNTTHFEQHFSEQALRKGLQHVKKNRLHEGQRERLNYSFTVDAHTVQLKKKGDALLSAQCSCGRAPRCEHLSAVLFYLERHRLDVFAGAAPPPKRTQKQASPAHQLRPLLEGASAEQLRLFIHEQATRQPLFRELAVLYFSDRSEQQALAYYRSLVKNAVSATNPAQVTQAQLNRITHALGQAVSSAGQRDAGPYYLHLAVLTEVPALLYVPARADATALLQLGDFAQTELESAFSRGLSEPARQAWITAAMDCLTASRQRTGRLVFFLVVRAIALLQQGSALRELRKKLDTNTLHFADTGTGPDQMTTLRDAVDLRMSDLGLRALPAKALQPTATTLYARVELYLCYGEQKKAFAYLRTHFGLLTEAPQVRADLAILLAARARDLGQPLTESQLLGHAVLLAPHLATAQLDRFLEVNPLPGGKKEITRLEDALRQQNNRAASEKLLVLLVKLGRIPEALEELGRQPNRFNLVHAMAQRLLPFYNKALSTVYAGHLTEALREARYTPQQQQLFLRAQRYINALPGRVAQRLVNQVLQGLRDFPHLHGFILGHYPQAAAPQR